MESLSLSRCSGALIPWRRSTYLVRSAHAVVIACLIGVNGALTKCDLRGKGNASIRDEHACAILCEHACALGFRFTLSP